MKRFLFSIPIFFALAEQLFGAAIDPSSIFSPNLQVHVASSDSEGTQFTEWKPELRNRRQLSRVELQKSSGHNSTSNGQLDYIDLNRTLSFNEKTIHAKGPNVVELVIVVDKELGDVFSQDYNRIVDYLAVYFWDVNMRYQSLPNVDISFRVNGILIMSDKESQPFIEKARASDGRTELGRILNLYKYWVYQQRGWLVKHDLAPLLTASHSEWGGGLAWMHGACWVHEDDKADLGTSVWNDIGSWGSITVGAHELGHNLGMDHDDEPHVNCPHGFIMAGGNDERRYFFSKCSDEATRKFIDSDQSACLRRIDGYSTTPIDAKFSSPKAPDMQEQCRRNQGNPNAFVDPQDQNCKSFACKWRDATNPNVYWVTGQAPAENSICPNGRCFRGRCRKESKLLRNAGTGLCMILKERFGFMVMAQMWKCPENKDKTPLETIEVIDAPNGVKMLSTPFLDNGNQENGDRCLYTGNSNGGAIWTDRCNPNNQWHGWEFRTVSNGFLLAHKVTGRCAKSSNQEGGSIQTFGCNQNDKAMIWNWD